MVSLSKEGHSDLEHECAVKYAITPTQLLLHLNQIIPKLQREKNYIKTLVLLMLFDCFNY